MELNESVPAYPSVILAPCVVPWNERFELEEEVFRAAIRRIAQSLTKYVYSFGTAGEGYAVSDTQFHRVTAVFVDEARRCGADPCVGLVSLSLRTLIERAEFAASIGVTTFQFALPSWGALTDRELKTLCVELLDRFPSAHFIHYNVSRSCRVLGADEYGDLARRHPNLVGAKYTSSDYAEVARSIKAAPTIRFFPSDNGYPRLRDLHDVGWIPSAGMANFERALRFFAARGEELAGLGDELASFDQAWPALGGSGAHMDGAFDKAVLKLSMPDFPLRLLPPYSSASKDDFERFERRVPLPWRTVS